MSDQFIFFCVNVSNEKLLKEEVKNFYPELTLSYSRKGFLTFKNLGVIYDLTTIAQLHSTFATRVGISLGKASPSDILEKITSNCDKLELELDKCIIHSFSINTGFVLDAKNIFKKEVNGYSANEKIVFDIISLSDTEIWFGVHAVAKGITRFPNAHVEIEVPHNAPSRAYLKLAQLVELYSLKLGRVDSCLDFGSSPGGASLFLLSKGCKVWGIDTAKMSSVVTQHSKYTHISAPVQNLSQEDLPNRRVEWIHVDLNLNPTQAIKEVLRLAKKYNSSLLGIIFTVQLTNLDYVKDIENFEDQFYDWGFSSIKSVQVPSHKQEYAIIAKKGDY